MHPFMEPLLEAVYATASYLGERATKPYRNSQYPVLFVIMDTPR